MNLKKLLTDNFVILKSVLLEINFEISENS